MICAHIIHSSETVSENFLADLPVIIPLNGGESNASSSGSGNSSPQHSGEPAEPAGPGGAKPPDMEFGVDDDLDMWDVLLGMDGARILAASLPPSCESGRVLKADSADLLLPSCDPTPHGECADGLALATICRRC